MNYKYPTVQQFSIGSCKNSYSSKMGIPCSLEIKLMFLNGQQLMKENFDSQWWLSDHNSSESNNTQLSCVNSIDHFNSACFEETNSLFGTQQNPGETEITAWSSQESSLFSLENLQAIQERFVYMKHQKLFVLKEKYFFRYNNTTPHR